MVELKKSVIDIISKSIPEFESVELKGNVGDNSYSIEFFLTINGERKQCYELVDNGFISEVTCDNICKEIVDKFRQIKACKKGEQNKLQLTIVK